MPFDFHFSSNSSAPDNPALVDHLILIMSARENQNRQVLLFGFADSEGSPDHNDKLSEQRARAVERKLIDKGIHPAAAEGFGQEYPLTSNDSEEGRRKNRRVEVWLRR